MKVQLITGGVLALFLLAGCETTTTTPVTTTAPTASAPAGVTQESANQLVMTFSVNRALAESYARECASVGFALREPSRGAAITAFDDALIAKGYTKEMIRRAESIRDRQRDSVARAVIKDLMAKGVKRGDVGSFCSLGKREIAAKSAIGRQLKLT